MTLPECLSDGYIFPASQVLLLLVCLYAILRRPIRKLLTRNRPVSVDDSVTRGEVSWNMFVLSYGVASVLFLQIINASKALDGYKVLLSIVDIGLLIYLFFYNGWFRNSVITFVSKAKQLEERC